MHAHTCKHVCIYIYMIHARAYASTEAWKKKRKILTGTSATVLFVEREETRSVTRGSRAQRIVAPDLPIWRGSRRIPS